jgi:hypothetical protein
MAVLALANTIILGSESRGAHNHILQSHDSGSSHSESFVSVVTLNPQLYIKLSRFLFSFRGNSRFLADIGRQLFSVIHFLISTVNVTYKRVHVSRDK